MNRIKRLIARSREKLSELDQQKAEIDRDREKLIFHIQQLEDDLAQETPRKRGRPKNGRSVPDLAEKILESKPEGLSVPGLLTELRKEGYEPDSKDPVNTINAHLHGEKERFRRLSDGRWMSAKFPEPKPVIDETFVGGAILPSFLSEFPKFLIKIVGEKPGLNSVEIGIEATRRGWDFQGKRPTPSVHFGLLNAVKLKIVEMRDGRWFMRRPQALTTESEVSRTGSHGQDKDEKTTLH